MYCYIYVSLCKVDSYLWLVECDVFVSLFVELIELFGLLCLVMEFELEVYCKLLYEDVV